MSTLTAIKLTGEAFQTGLIPDAKVSLSEILELTDIIVKRDYGEAWLIMESPKPLDAEQLKDNLADWSIFPAAKIEVNYQRSPDGTRHAEKGQWEGNGTGGRLPDILKNEFYWYGLTGGRWTQDQQLGSQLGNGQHQITIDLEPLLFHKLNVAALENGQSLDEFIMEILEERVDG